MKHQTKFHTRLSKILHACVTVRTMCNEQGGTSRMTANQVAYWTLMEQKRANLVDEKERNRANQAKEQENIRSNKAREALTDYDNATKRMVGKSQKLRNEAEVATMPIKALGSFF